MNAKRRAIQLLKELRNTSDNQQNEILTRVNSTPADRDAMEYLEAAGLVKVSRALGGDIVFCHLLPGSSKYLQDQKDHVREKWIDRLVGFLAGIATSVVSYFIIQAVQASIR